MSPGRASLSTRDELSSCVSELSNLFYIIVLVFIIITDALNVCLVGLAASVCDQVVLKFFLQKAPNNSPEYGSYSSPTSCFMPFKPSIISCPQIVGIRNKKR